jgi:hypothetical protein
VITEQGTRVGVATQAINSLVPFGAEQGKSQIVHKWEYLALALKRWRLWQLYPKAQHNHPLTAEHMPLGCPLFAIAKSLGWLTAGLCI